MTDSPFLAFLRDRHAPQPSPMIGLATTTAILDRGTLVARRPPELTYEPQTRRRLGGRWQPRRGWSMVDSRESLSGMFELGAGSIFDQAANTGITPPSTNTSPSAPWWQNLLTPLVQAGSAVLGAKAQAKVLKTNAAALSPNVYSAALASTNAARAYEAAERARAYESKTGTMSVLTDNMPLILGGLLVLGIGAYALRSK